MFCITNTLACWRPCAKPKRSAHVSALWRKSLRRRWTTARLRGRALQLRAETNGQDNGAAETDDAQGRSEGAGKYEPGASSAADPELERLRLAVERAKLEAERAKLQAERARLEAEKARIESEKRRLAKEKEREQAQLLAKSQSAAPVGALVTEESADTSKRNQSADSAVDAKNSNGPPAERNNTTPNNMDPALRRAVESGSIDEKSMMLLSQIGPFALGGGISDEDLKTLQQRVLTFDTYMMNQMTRTPIGVVIRGRLRAQSPAEAYERFEKALSETGLDARIRLFLMEDPRSPFLVEDDMAVENANGAEKTRLPPIVVAMPITSEPPKAGLWQYLLAGVLGATALFTTFGYGVGVFGLSPDFVQQITRGNVDVVTETLPVSIGAIGILVVHELGHRIMGALRNVKQGLSYVIPSLQIGYYGCVTPLRSFPRNRSALFDVAVAGPVAGLAASMLALIAGLILTAQQGSTPLDWFPQIPSGLFDASLLIGALGKAVLPQSVLSQPTIAVHPLCVVGYTGLLSQALQLLPVGRTDGGRMMQAAFGRRTAGRASGVALLLQGLSSILGNSPLLLFYGLIVIFLQREQEIPCLDEVSEPNNSRTAMTFFLLLVTVLILLPFPSQFGDITGQF
ncbi:Peptidase M50 [Cyanidiococcus yangmingshanensis]|uniref:Peptidase M50 n=1 Tax=Cyanidiococcus yangmingshanensis TaxID=2690220 RepID=A0A7J7IQ76_9RHOD|nr:Peptidase M50 [Cyanidiococcus yangmingshanensis]